MHMCVRACEERYGGYGGVGIHANTEYSAI